MRHRSVLASFATLVVAAAMSHPSESAHGAEAPPAWAYPLTPPDFKFPPDRAEIRHVPDSSITYTETQLRDRFIAKDWHPEDHPSMPEIVAFGRKPGVFACSHCHRPDGVGGPENSSLAGLPSSYFVQQMIDFKSGARKSSVPQRIPVALMQAIARSVADDEVVAAAEYFAALKLTKRIKVIETDSAPKTYVAWLIYAASSDETKEPIGQRIVEVPNNLEQFERYDSRAGFTAYVPIGSIAKGEALATSGSVGKTIACGTCHGADLRGLGPIPGITGRSPSYIVRQLYDLKHEERAGPWSPLMAKVVSNLDEEDFVSIAAYLAARDP
jgi:cytochrome c553